MRSRTRSGQSFSPSVPIANREGARPFRVTGFSPTKTQACQAYRWRIKSQSVNLADSHWEPTNPPILKVNQLVFTLLLLLSAPVFQLPAQQIETDRKQVEEVKAKAEAGDANSQNQLGL